MSRISNEHITQSIQRGIRYLENAQLTNGEFKMFFSPDPMMCREYQFDSSLFGTAMIVYALGHAPKVLAQPMLRRSLRFLLRGREAPGVWRYWTRTNPMYKLIAPDLDDTCLISFVLRQNAIPSNTNDTLILANRNQDGLFYTWLLMRASPTWIKLQFWKSTLLRLRKFSPQHYNWLWRETEAKPGDVGAGVNANVLLYLGESPDTEAVVSYLVNMIRQRHEASCDEYYSDPLVIYYLLSRAYFHGVRGLEVVQDAIAERTVHSAAMIQNSLAAALSVSTLLNAGSHSPFSEAIDYLLETQHADGSWAKTAMWWGGPKRLRGFGSEELTTALCVEALARYCRTLGVDSH
jgi:hypothetical protein